MQPKFSPLIWKKLQVTVGYLSAVDMLRGVSNAI